MTGTPLSGPPLFSLQPLLEDIDKENLRLDATYLQTKYETVQFDADRDFDKRSLSHSRSTLYGEDEERGSEDGAYQKIPVRLSYITCRRCSLSLLTLTRTW